LIQKAYEFATKFIKNHKPTVSPNGCTNNFCLLQSLEKKVMVWQQLVYI